MAARDLGKMLDWEKSRLSHQLRRMETDGLISRDPKPGRRPQHHGPTRCRPDAPPSRKAAPEHVEDVRRNFTDLLSPAELDTLAALNERILHHLATRERLPRRRRAFLLAVISRRRPARDQLWRPMRPTEWSSARSLFVPIAIRAAAKIAAVVSPRPPPFEACGQCIQQPLTTSRTVLPSVQQLLNSRSAMTVTAVQIGLHPDVIDVERRSSLNSRG